MTTPTPEHHPAPATAEPLLRAQDYAERRDWLGYFRAVAGKPPRDTLIEALRLFDLEPSPREPRLAVDLGCGEGRDTAELLRRGWRVIAVDAHPQAIDLLRARPDLVHVDRLQYHVADFSAAPLPTCNLVNASYALPFCPRTEFDALWRRITTALIHGARFAGQLFGDRDDWAKRGDSIHHTRRDLDHLFADFVIDSLIEEDRDSADALGNPKRWHVYHVVARRR